MLPMQSRALHRAVFLVCLLPSFAWAQASSGFVNRCAEWIAKKGYSVDYIEQRTGQRPRGNMAADWRANLEPANLKPGDVVFLSSGNSGQRRYRPRAYSKVTIWTFGRRQAGGWRVPSIRQRQED
jgi:hypothetical protein